MLELDQRSLKKRASECAKPKKLPPKPKEKERLVFFGAKQKMFKGLVLALLN